MQRQANLPRPSAAVDLSDYDRELLHALNDIFEDYAREINRREFRGPVVTLDRNGVDQALTVGAQQELVLFTRAPIDTHTCVTLGATPRVTPTIAGLYEATFIAAMTATSFPAGGFCGCRIRRNGTVQLANIVKGDGSTTLPVNPIAQCIVECNGVTDYIDFVVANAAGSVAPNLLGATNRTLATVRYIGTRTPRQ